jgi:hypothetical protein
METVRTRESDTNSRYYKFRNELRRLHRVLERWDPTWRRIIAILNRYVVSWNHGS